MAGYNAAWCMDMFSLPSIFDWLDRLEPLRGLPTLYVLALLSLLILVVNDWRITLLALMGHYLLAGLLFAEVLLPHLAFVKVLTGLFVCLILYVTARQALPLPPGPAGPPARWQLGPLLVANTWPWRLCAGLLVALLTLFFGQRPGNLLPGMDASLAHVNGAVLLLFVLGLLQMSLFREAWRIGVGFFLALTGFELFYSNLTQSPGTLMALTAVSLGISLAIAYLAQKQRQNREFTVR